MIQHEFTAVEEDPEHIRERLFLLLFSLLYLLCQRNRDDLSVHSAGVEYQRVRIGCRHTVWFLADGQIIILRAGQGGVTPLPGARVSDEYRFRRDA